MNTRHIILICSFLFFCCASNNQPAVSGATQIQAQTGNSADSAQTAAYERLYGDMLAALDQGHFDRMMEAYQDCMKYVSAHPPAVEEQEKIVSKTMAAFSVFVTSIDIKTAASPAETIKNGTFKSPYAVTVTDKKTREALAGVPLTVTYPVAAKNGECEFGSAQVVTDEDGKAVFNPPKPTFACNSQVTFSLHIPEAAADIVIPAQSAPYKVYTDLRARGGSIAITDLGKNGKPLTSTQTSSFLLTELIRRSGFSNIGNSDFAQAVTADNPQTVQKEARSLFGSSVTYLIYGTTSYTTDNNNGKAEVTLTAKIRVRNLVTDTQLYEKEIVITAADAREANALVSARQTLAVNLADELKYNL